MCHDPSRLSSGRAADSPRDPDGFWLPFDKALGLCVAFSRRYSRSVHLGVEVNLFLPPWSIGGCRAPSSQTRAPWIAAYVRNIPMAPQTFVDVILLVWTKLHPRLPSAFRLSNLQVWSRARQNSMLHRQMNHTGNSKLVFAVRPPHRNPDGCGHPGHTLPICNADGSVHRHDYERVTRCVAVDHLYVV